MSSNVLLYHLQRHCDHHANPLRRYQALRHFDEAPELPSGYATMIVLAYVTPLWRRVMDPRVLAHYGGDVTRANIHPRSARDPRRYGVPGCGMSPIRCPVCEYVYDEAEGAPARGVPGGHAVDRGARRLALPGLRGAREGRLRGRC